MFNSLGFVFCFMPNIYEFFFVICVFSRFVKVILSTNPISHAHIHIYIHYYYHYYPYIYYSICTIIIASDHILLEINLTNTSIGTIYIDSEPHYLCNMLDNINAYCVMTNSLKDFVIIFDLLLVFITK